MPPKLSYEHRALLLFALVLASLVLITLVTFSAPFIPRISFLAFSNPRTTFGVFGFCDGTCTRKAAYEWGAAINTSLTGAMLLWPICLGFTLFAQLAIVLLLAQAGNRPLFLLAMGGSTVCLFFAWLLGVFGWSVARRALALEGREADLGPAHWMGLAAMACMGCSWIVGWPRDERARAGVTIKTKTVQQPAPPAPQAPHQEYYHYRRTTREYTPATRV